MLKTISMHRLLIPMLALLAAVVLFPQQAHAASVTIDLCATTGTTSLPGSAAIPVLGYVLGDCTGSPTVATPGGPVLAVTEGDVVTVVLHNNLAEASGLLFQGQAIVPDRVGTGAGQSKTYVFTANSAGTYLYEAGLLPNGQHQVAMGLYGALIVRPTTPNQAYATADTAYDDEAVVVLSELSNAAVPATFDLRKYKPRYWLINGKAYPGTDSFATAPGRRVLIRYVNAGLQLHSMGMLGLNQTVIAQDGSLLSRSHRMVAETIAPGQTADSIVTVPAAAAAGSKFALYDGNLMLNNTNLAGFGGMLAFLTIPAGSGGADTTGPIANGVALSPNPTNGAADVALAASLSELTTGGANIAAAEYFVDTVGAAGSGTAMAGAFGATTANVNGTLPSALLATLASGVHTIFVRGQDSLGNWGSTNFAVLNLDKLGPATLALGLNPSPTNGAVNVVLSGSGSDTASGGSNVVGAEYFIDATGANGVGVAMSLNGSAPSVSLNATIAASSVNALSEGAHNIYVHSLDSFGNWGAFAATSLLVDKSAPQTAGVSISPNPNNGTIGIPNVDNPPSARIDATVSDASIAMVASAASPEAVVANNLLFMPIVTNPDGKAARDVVAAVAAGVPYVAAAEGFIDVPGANGTGFVFKPIDGVFDGLSEAVYALVPETTIAQLNNGEHTIFVHAQDAAGNWGATSTTTLVVDKIGPATGSVTLNPSAVNNASVAVSAPASDAATGNQNVVAGEYFIDTAAGNGTGIAMNVSPVAPATTLSANIPAATIAALATGNHTVYVRAKDAVGTWGAASSALLLIDRNAPTFSGVTLSPNAIVVGTATVNLTVTGASDGAGGSGVAGGEFWLCPPNCTNPAPGAGTAFSGLSASIPVGSLAAGQQYTVRARVRDAAGNWSTGGNGIRSTVLTVTTTDNIFTDGFESGSLPGAWSSRSTTTTSRLNATNGAALFGAFGLQAQGNNTNYVQANFSAEPIYDARFYFRRNTVSSTGMDVLSTATASNFATTVFRVRYRLNGAQPQVQIQVGTGNANATWTNINSATTNVIEVVWQAVGSGGPNPGTLQLYVNGVLAQTLTTASTSSVGAVRLGAVTNTGNNQPLHFDAFASKRTASPVIGP